MHTQDAYLKHARYCERMAQRLGTPLAKALRLREARDWKALACAHGAAIPPDEDSWSALQRLSIPPAAR